MALEGNSKMDTEKPFPAVETAFRWIEGRLALRRGKILVRVSFFVFSDKFLSFF